MNEHAVLYIVATPIGNLGDLSPRAAAVLRDADFVAAEDTRVTLKLLNHLGIKKPMVSYYRHNTSDSGERILARIAAGESCALCSDAGTPAISDPGELLVRGAIERGIRVVPVPGPCAAVAALSASGLVTGRFCFEGFLPVSKKNRRAHLEAIAGETRTMVFYEAPHKLVRTLTDLVETLGDRKLTLARELTKLHEEIEYTTLSAALATCTDRAPRGEYVLVVEGGVLPAPATVSDAEALAVVAALRRQGLALSEACRLAAVQTGHKKSALYKRAVEAGE